MFVLLSLNMWMLKKIQVKLSVLIKKMYALITLKFNSIQIVQYAACLYIKLEQWRWKHSLQMLQTVQWSELLSSLRGIYLHYLYHQIDSDFLAPLFCCIFFLLEETEEQGTFSFSSFSSDSEAFITCLTGITFFPCLLCFLFPSPVMQQFVFRTSKTDWLKQNLLTSSVAFKLGSFLKPHADLVDTYHML